MRFLVDAQLPRRLVDHLRQEGHDAIHTLDLPLGNQTPDTLVNDLSISQKYILVTKDSDFVDTFLLHKRP